MTPEARHESSPAATVVASEYLQSRRTGDAASASTGLEALAPVDASNVENVNSRSVARVVRDGQSHACARDEPDVPLGRQGPVAVRDKCVRVVRVR